MQILNLLFSYQKRFVLLNSARVVGVGILLLILPAVPILAFASDYLEPDTFTFSVGQKLGFAVATPMTESVADLSLSLNTDLSPSQGVDKASPKQQSGSYTVYLPMISVTPTGWVSRTSGVTDLLYSIGCSPDGQTCVVGGQGVALYSEDGGSSWQTTATNLTGTELYGAACASSGLCVVVGRDSSGGVVFVSNDGGKNWISKPDPPSQMNAIDCPVADQCVAVGQGSWVYYTLNSGVTWESGSLGSAHLYGVDCIGSTGCWMVGQDGRVITSFGTGKKDIYGPPTVRYLRSVSCLDSYTCVAAGETFFGTPAPYPGVIAKTTNAWGSWSTYLYRETEMTHPGGKLAGVSCPDSTYCYVVGVDGKILMSGNGGSNWSEEVSPTTLDLNDIYCTSPINCLAVGANGTIIFRRG